VTASSALSVESHEAWDHVPLQCSGAVPHAATMNKTDLTKDLRSVLMRI
jgi:hypothetical protein